MSVSRKRHPKKDVEKVLSHLESIGWVVEVRHSSGHAWGLLRCPNNDHDCRCGEFCQMSISSTPQNPASHAAKLENKALSCIYLLDEKEKDDGIV
jgi:hypothetical protein